jgi:hypothetical protein
MCVRWGGGGVKAWCHAVQFQRKQTPFHLSICHPTRNHPITTHSHAYFLIPNTHTLIYINIPLIIFSINKHSPPYYYYYYYYYYYSHNINTSLSISSAALDSVATSRKQNMTSTQISVSTHIHIHICVHVYYNM